MPQASEELRALFPDGDRQAYDHLFKHGFRLRANWTWVVPAGHQWTQRDEEAIAYLRDEWDYGGVSLEET